MRYKVCVHANATNSTNEKWTQIIPAVSACSDGVVVDTTPPSPSTVWIGWKEHNQYQVRHMSDQRDLIDAEELLKITITKSLLKTPIKDTHTTHTHPHTHTTHARSPTKQKYIFKHWIVHLWLKESRLQMY